MPSPHERLDRAMDARRLELDLEWQEVAVAAKISTATLRAIRSGDTNPRALTKKRLEDALRWKRGTFDAILQESAADSGEDEHQPDHPEDPLVRLLDEDPAELARKLSPEQLQHYIDRLIEFRNELVRRQEQREAQPNGR